jgi:hypothetical protein
MKTFVLTGAKLAKAIVYRLSATFAEDCACAGSFHTPKAIAVEHMISTIFRLMTLPL